MFIYVAQRSAAQRLGLRLLQFNSAVTSRNYKYFGKCTFGVEGPPALPPGCVSSFRFTDDAGGYITRTKPTKDKSRRILYATDVLSFKSKQFVKKGSSGFN